MIRRSRNPGRISNRPGTGFLAASQMPRRLLQILALASTVLLPSEVVAAQQVEPLFRARVVADETGRPVPGIQVRMVRGPWVMTDSQGYFEVAGVPEGAYAFSLVTPRCDVSYGTLQLVYGLPFDIQLSFPEALAPEVSEVDRRGHEGAFVTASDIEAMRARTLLDVVRRVAPEMVDGTATVPGQSVSLRGRNRATVGGVTRPLFFLDEVQVGDGGDLLLEIPPGDVAAMELISSASGGWMYGHSGGVVRIWTKRGEGEPRPMMSPDECEIPPPPGVVQW